MEKIVTKKATPENVLAACEAIKGAGLEPSVRLVRERLGGGSPNEIAPLVTRWKSSLAAKGADVQIDPRIGQIITEHIAKAVSAARAELHAQISSAQDDLDLMNATANTYQEQVALLEGQSSATSSQLQSALGQIEQLKSDLVGSEEKLTRERAALRDAQVQLAKAQLQLEALPKQQERIREIEHLLSNEQRLRHEAERGAAAAEAKAAGLTDRLADAQSQRAEAERELKAQLDEQKRRNTQLEEGLAQLQAEARESAALIGRLESRIEASRSANALEERSGRRVIVGDLLQEALGKYLKDQYQALGVTPEEQDDQSIKP